nr:immunoglobulin heavy chain junction region [Mus musculus]
SVQEGGGPFTTLTT